MREIKFFVSVLLLTAFLGTSTIAGIGAENVTKEQINNAFKENQNETIKITNDPIVSSDIIGSHLGALVDSLLTNVLDDNGKQLVKVVAWYDNEMGYSAQMVRTAKYLGGK